MKRKAVVLLCLVLALVMSACGKEKELSEKEPYIYYVDAKGVSLVKQNFELSGNDVENQVEAVLNALKNPKEDVEYGAAIPEKVKIVDFTINESDLDLYFNRAYRKMSREVEILCRAAVVQSLAQIPGIESVRFYVDNSELMDKNGVPIGYMRAEDFVQNIGPALNSYQKATLTLYYSNSNGDALKEGTVNVRYNSNILIEKLIVEQLIKGTSINSGKSAIPKDTKLLSVSVRDEICYVNFDEGFLSHGYEGDPKVTIYSIVNSLIKSGTVKQVQISVNGETALSFHGMIDLSKPFTEDFSLLEEKK